MIEADLRAVWRVRSRGEEREIDRALITLLGVLGHSGNLRQAAQATGISYRHAWNLVVRWGAFLGEPIATMRRGRGTRLTPLGERLHRAVHQAQAQLAPELDGLASDFAGTLNAAIEPGDARRRADRGIMAAPTRGVPR